MYFDRTACPLWDANCLKKSILRAELRKKSFRREPFSLQIDTYVFAISIGDPGWGAATFAEGLGAMVGGPPGLTMVGGIAGLTKRSDVRLLDGATICPCFAQTFASKDK